MLPPLSRMGPHGSPPSSPLDFDYIKQSSNTLLSWSTGVVIFPACLGIFQVFVFRPLQLTCASFGASFFGAGSIAVAGVAASVGLMGTSGYLLKFGDDTPDAVFTHLNTKHLVFNSTASTFWFYLLGGRFHSVLPSSLLHPGAFAKSGQTASFNYASNDKKMKLNAQGKRAGCHTCGKRWFINKFIADHQPPLYIIRDMMQKRHYILGIIPIKRHIPKQRFYPQCNGCSLKQQGYLSAVSRAKVRRLKLRWRHIVTHATTMRLYHVWLPMPFILHTLQTLCS